MLSPFQNWHYPARSKKPAKGGENETLFNSMELLTDKESSKIGDGE